MLLASLAVAARRGFEMPDALDVAQRTYVNVNIHDDANADRLCSLAQLPASCAQSAECLQRDRALYESANVFPKAMIDGVIARLKAHNDADLAAQAHRDPTLMSQLVAEYFHCG